MFLAGTPPTATAQQKGVYVRQGRARFYVKAKVRRAERTWFSRLYPYRRALAQPLDGPVLVSIRLVFPFTADTSKKTRLAGRNIPHGRRPDIDNLVKALLDTMTKMRFWHDDGQIFALCVAKYRGAKVGTTIHVQTLAELTHMRMEDLIEAEVL